MGAIVGKWRRLGTVRVCGVPVACRRDPRSDRLGHEWATEPRRKKSSLGRVLSGGARAVHPADGSSPEERARGAARALRIACVTAMRGTGWALAGVGVVVVAVVAKKAKKRGYRAASVYVKEIESGARPIEAVGTAIAAFVGLP